MSYLKRRILLENAEIKNEKVSKEDVEAGKKLADTEIGEALFEKMDDNPEIQEALKELLDDLGASGSLDEKDDASGSAAFAGGIGGTVGGLKAGYAVEAALLKGAPAVVPAKTAIASLLATAGLPVAGFVGGALVGYLLYKGASKLLSKEKSESDTVNESTIKRWNKLAGLLKD